MTSRENNDLLRRCLDEHYDEILNFMYIRVHNRPDAEDLTQEVFLAITKNIHSYQQNASLRTWIFSIARNILNSEYRKKSRLNKLLKKLQIASVFKRKHIDEQMNTDLFLLLDKLTDADKDLVILKHYFGFSYDDIAIIMNLSPSNVGVRLSRSIEKLKAMSDERSDGYEQA